MTKNRKPSPVKRKWSPGRWQRIDLTLVNFEVNNDPKIVQADAVNEILDEAMPLLVGK